MEHRYAVILAGGSGTRLWPLSRTARPKQLLALTGGESLLQQTARRLLPMTPPEQVVVVTQDSYRFEVMGQLHALHSHLADHVLAEPVGRNTLPAIAWAAALIHRRDPSAMVGVFSSDHAIADTAAFLEAWAIAEEAAAAGSIALFGIEPSHAATGYGYIQAVEKEGAVRRVARFVEKPDQATAETYIAGGDYFWNSGMFVFRADVFLAMVESRYPELYAAVAGLAEAVTAPTEIYGALPDLSIDYGLLEDCPDLAVVPVSMGWSDLGSWEAVYQHQEKDDRDNFVTGDVTTVDCHGNLFWSDRGLVAALGVNDLAVVQTFDATLICPRSRVEELKSLVAEVRKTHKHLTETHTTVNRPWGSFTVLEEGPRYKIKRIVVNPGAKLSLQMHYHRSEHWVVIAGTARIVNGDQEIHLRENESTYIAQVHRHRLENPGRVPLQIIEIQSGEYLGEDDIVRFDDHYGRHEC